MLYYPLTISDDLEEKRVCGFHGMLFWSRWYEYHSGAVLS